MGMNILKKFLPLLVVVEKLSVGDLEKSLDFSSLGTLKKIYVCGGKITVKLYSQRIWSFFFLLFPTLGCFGPDSANKQHLSEARVQEEENTKTDPKPEPSAKGAPESVEQNSELNSNKNPSESGPTQKSNNVGARGEEPYPNKSCAGGASKQIFCPLQEKVAIAKTYYPELTRQSFDAIVTTHYLKLSANYYFAAHQLNNQLVQSQAALEQYRKWHEFAAYKNPESPSFSDEVSDFRSMRYALDHEKSLAFSLRKNLEDLNSGWKNQCTNESIQKFVNLNDPKRVLPPGAIFRGTPVSPKNESSSFQDNTEELRREQERLLSDLSQFNANTLESKRQESFALSQKACREFFLLDFAEKLNQLVLKAQFHEKQIAIEQASYAQSWEKIAAAYSKFLLSRGEVYLKDLTENYLTRFDQTFSVLPMLDKQARVFIEKHLGPLEDEFEQIREQDNEAKALFKQRFWEALIQGDTQFHSGNQFYFANSEKIQNMIDWNFWHDFTGELKAFFLFEQEPSAL